MFGLSVPEHITIKIVNSFSYASSTVALVIANVN